MMPWPLSTDFWRKWLRRDSIAPERARINEQENVTSSESTAVEGEWLTCPEEWKRGVDMVLTSQLEEWAASKLELP
jgi:hypothetical protein